MNSALLMLVDGRFPAGGHTNSAGVEAAVRIGNIHDGDSLERFLLGRLATTGVVDAAFSAHVAAVASRESYVPSTDDLVLIDDEYSARVPSPRLRDASHKFGRQLLRAGSHIWSSPTLDAIAATGRGTHQPVALGALCAASGGTPSEAALLAFHHLSAAVTSAAIRLLGLDPMEAAALQARAGHVIDRQLVDADRWAASTPSALPACGGSLTEILAEDHGRWDARLFVA